MTHEHLTGYVADFICDTTLADLPGDVVTLGIEKLGEQRQKVAAPK